MDSTLTSSELLDDIPCGLVSFSDDGTVRKVNATLLSMLGYEPGDLVGGSVESIFSVSTRIFHQTHFFPLLKLHGKAEEIFLTLRARDGSHVPVLTNAVRRSFEGACVSHCVFVPVRQRQQYEQEILAAKRAAEEALQSNQELTEARRQLEQHAVELDRRVNDLGQQKRDLLLLASVLSHDLREPVRKISILSDIVRSEMDDKLTPIAEDALRKVGKACWRMDSIVGALRQYLAVQGNEGRLEDIDLGETLATAKARLRDEREPPDFEVRTGPLPHIEGHRRQLEMLFYHLLDNAVKFRSPDRPLQVHVDGAMVRHNRYRSTKDRYKYADFAQITFRDNGLGFDPQYAEYVFGMLKKIDPRAPGLGLGLALCRRIVDNHHGWITAEPEPANGVTFTILLAAESSTAPVSVGP